MLTESEMDTFERIIRFWNVFGCQLERVICCVLRDVISMVMEHCGMMQQMHAPLTPQQVINNPCCEHSKDGSLAVYKSDGLTSQLPLILWTLCFPENAL